MAERAAPRRILLRELISERSIGNQQDLLELLAQYGYAVTQATVSRDLAAIGAIKESGPAGERYSLLPAGEEGRAGHEALRRVLSEFAVAIVPSGPLVVLRTDEGAAGAVARALDRAALPGIVGSVAGDDTVLVVADEEVGGRTIAEKLNQILEGR